MTDLRLAPLDMLRRSLERYDQLIADPPPNMPDGQVDFWKSQRRILAREIEHRRRNLS